VVDHVCTTYAIQEERLFRRSTRSYPSEILAVAARWRNGNLNLSSGSFYEDGGSCNELHIS